MKDSFYSVEPHSELIRKCISHYYFHKSDHSEPKISFSYYPHYKNALTIYRNSKVEIIAGTHTKSSPHKDGYSYTYT